MNALLTQKLLKVDNNFTLDTVIWQDNQIEQSWRTLDTFGSQKQKTIALSGGVKTVENHYDNTTFERYCKQFNHFKVDLFAGKAQQIVLDIPIEEKLLINGTCQLNLTVNQALVKVSCPHSFLTLVLKNVFQIPLLFSISIALIMVKTSLVRRCVSCLSRKARFVS